METRMLVVCVADQWISNASKVPIAVCTDVFQAIVCITQYITKENHKMRRNHEKAINHLTKTDKESLSRNMQTQLRDDVNFVAHFAYGTRWRKFIRKGENYK